MALYEKLSNLVKNEKVLIDFLDFTLDIHKWLWCLTREDHPPNWCYGECTIMKFLNPIKKKIETNISIEEKKCFFYY